MRLLHTMLRVGNLDKSIDFYTNVLGMRVLRRNDYPDGKFTLAFVGYQDEAEGAVIELTHNWDTDKYDLGSGYGHIALKSTMPTKPVTRSRNAAARSLAKPAR